MAYPLFQKALQDSTPFPGTLADTSTPTPAGVQPQVPETPQPTQAPGRAGDDARGRELEENRALIQQQLEILRTHRNVRVSPWHTAFKLALNGNRDDETSRGAYQRIGMMNELLRTDAALAEEQRLRNVVSPAKQHDISEAAARERRARDMNFLDKFYSERKLPNPLPQEEQLLYVEKGYFHEPRKAGSEGDDFIKQLTAGARFGQEIPPEEVAKFGLEGKVGEAAMAGSELADKIRRERAERGDTDKYPVLDGLFKTPDELYRAMMTDYRETVKGEPYTLFEDYEAPDPVIPGATITRQRKIHPDAELRKDARADVASRWPGYEKYFPNFVEKGFQDVPAVETKQGDIDVKGIRERFRKKATEAKPKAD